MSDWEDGWIDIRELAPADAGQYLVCCPTGDPNNPLITLAWYDPTDRVAGEPACWSLIAPYWAEAIRWWMRIPEPPEPIMIKAWDDGTVEVMASEGDDPPTGEDPHGIGGSIWARRDGGAWRRVAGAASNFAALARIADCATAAEAMARLCPGGPA